jgi:hypothetical protein
MRISLASPGDCRNARSPRRSSECASGPSRGRSGSRAGGRDEAHAEARRGRASDGHEDGSLGVYLAHQGWDILVLIPDIARVPVAHHCREFAGPGDEFEVKVLPFNGGRT